MSGWSGSAGSAAGGKSCLRGLAIGLEERSERRRNIHHAIDLVSLTDGQARLGGRGVEIRSGKAAEFRVSQAGEEQRFDDQPIEFRRRAVGQRRRSIIAAQASASRTSTSCSERNISRLISQADRMAALAQRLSLQIS